MPSGGAGRGRPSVPEGLVAERFALDGVEYVCFTWPSGGSLDTLSAGERAVCELLVEGASNAEIARWRKTSARTVANQVASVLRKLDAASRFELIARFAGTGAR